LDWINLVSIREARKGQASWLKLLTWALRKTKIENSHHVRNPPEVVEAKYYPGSFSGMGYCSRIW
jgi:hypothetical protein